MWLPHPFPADFPRRARRGDGPADNEVSGAGPLGDAAADACGGGGTDAGGGRELHERDPEPGHGRRDGPDARRRRPRRRRRRPLAGARRRCRRALAGAAARNAAGGRRAPVLTRPAARCRPRGAGS